MYSVDRIEAASLLGMSTRTIDRYIRSGKIRSKKVGKKVFLHDEDIKIIQNGGIQEDYIVIGADGEVAPTVADHSFTRRPVVVDYKDLFEEAQRSINRKDDLIRELSYRVGQAEAELKNSISMIEYKKATLLLESSNKKNEEEKKALEGAIESLEDRVIKGNSVNIILFAALMLLLIISIGFWVVNL